MGKKRVFKSVLSLILSLVMAVSLLPANMLGSMAEAKAADPDVVVENIASTERKIKINSDWRFCLLDKSRTMNNSLDDTASQSEYEESGTWNTVQLPHDWSIYQEFNDSEARPAQGSLAGGTGWYRKSFTLSDDMKDKNIVLQFDAVQMVSQIWINGHDLGKQYHGYVTFEYDITKYLKFNGEENVIAVKAYASRNSSRWYAGAGIYGSVYLITTEKVHVPVNGIHVATVVKEGDKWMQPDFHTEPDMDALKAESNVNVRTNVTNKTDAAVTVTVKSTIYSKKNDNVASDTAELTIPAPAEGEEEHTERIDRVLSIKNPALWSPDDPNLYWVRTEILQDGAVIDTLDTRFGIRYLYLNPGSYDAPYSEANTIGGLFINGEYTRINGMCEHRDLGALGMETYQAAIDRRIRKLKAMGVNVVRCAHDPVSPEYIEAADRLGMLVFEEGFDQWIKAKNDDDYHNYFNKAADGTTMVFNYSGADGTDTHINWTVENGEIQTPNCVRDIQAMVDRDKNSPAIFLWSTGNEIYDSSDGHGIDTQWLLSAAIKEIDSLDNIPWQNVVNKETKRTERPEPEENHAALAASREDGKTDYGVRGGGNTVEGGVDALAHGARYGRPISAAPPTWDQGSSKVTRKYGFIDNMAMADIGGHNYSRATNQYTTHKKRYPNACVAGTETVSAFYTRGVYNIEDYKGGNEEGSRWAHGSGYASEWPYNKNFTSASISIREHRDDMMPFMFGEMVWTGHDYLGEPTPHSSPSRSSYFGIIDTAGFEKDAFYMYRSAWTDIPTVHLLPQKWNWDMGTQVPVMVYTNAASVEVFINGKSIGVKQYDRDHSQPVYLDYGYQEYQAGELKAVAKDKDGNVIAEDVVYTAGSAKSVVLSGEKAFIKNDGSDLLYVEATVVDSAGNMVPTADNRITFSVAGGEIVALDNGDPRDREPFRGKNNNNNSNTSDNRKAFNGKALAIIKATEGSTENIVVTATADLSGGGKIGSNVLTVGSVAEIGDGTEVARYDLPEVTTGIGITPVLPETVGIVYDNGQIEERTISDWNMDGLDLNAAGDYTVMAVADGLKEPVPVTIHVKEVSLMEEVEVTTVAGIEPPLPNFISVTYRDGSSGSAKVAWDEVDPSLYAEEGIFDVNGKIGENKTVTAEVMVKEIASVEELAVSTERGSMPELPSTVNVTFTDGSTEEVGVKWNISENDVIAAGQKKITGSVLSSATQAVVWLNVSTVVYASDLVYEADENSVFKDAMSNGELLQARGMQGGPGETYAKGFGTKAPAEIVIDIKDKGYERFRSFVNLSLLKGGVAAPGAVAFKVYLDDETEPVFSSGEMNRADEAKLVDIDVTGKSRLRLVTESKSENPEDDLADWVNARFLSAHITIDEILTPQVYTAEVNKAPELPDMIQASVAGIEEPVAFHVEWLTPVSDAMFSSGTVQTVYGRLEGTEDMLIAFKYIPNYAEACKTEGFTDKVGSWSMTETFNYANVASGKKVKFNAMKLTPRLLYAGSSNMLVENVGNYGFTYGIYPEPANGDYAVFAAPDLRYFRIKNVAYSEKGSHTISDNNSFTFETSVDGETWTAFDGFTKGEILPGTGTDGVWAQRYYTSNEDAAFPAGTNFLRVKYPDGLAWRFNITEITLEGGDGTEKPNADLAGFTLGGYEGMIDQEARTVQLPVSSSLDITSIEPEISVFPGATVSPTGKQDFTNPVTYTVTNGDVTKEYTVTVSRGVNVTFHPYGGTINGSAEPVVNFISKNGTVLSPVSPEREGYLFGGWTTERGGKEAMQPEEMQFEQDTVFYAIWSKDMNISVKVSADADTRTWKTEKNTNYGSEGNLLLRQTNNTASYGQFGENFNNTSTDDGTDMKTAFIRFSLEDVKEYNIKSVKLALHYAGNQNQPGTNTIKFLVARANSDWAENKVTFVTRPALIDPANIVESEEFSATSSGSRTVNIDVTDLYQTLTEEDTDITFAITVNTNARDFRVTSKEGGANAPKLLVEVDKDPDYMVTYDLNGGTGTVPIQSTADAGTAFTAAGGTGITGANGSLFAGWNTEADGTGTFYQAGDEVLMPAADLTLYAVYKMPVTITPNNQTVEITGNTLDLSAENLFTVDSNAGEVRTYSLLSGGTGKGRVDKTDGRTLTVSRFGTFRIQLATSETDTHMPGKAVVMLTVKEAGTEEDMAAVSLKKLYDVWSGEDLSVYTKESAEALEAALAEAEAVLADSDAARKELDQAITGLVKAISSLKYAVQKLHLETAIEAAEAILALGETYDNSEALERAVTDGKAVFEDETKSQEEVDNAAYAILDELFKLAKTTDLSNLEKLIESAKNLLDGMFTDESLKNLKDAIDAAEIVVGDQNRTDGAIHEAYGNLVNAIINLQIKNNKAALKAILKKANEVLSDRDAYVAKTIEGLAEETAEAQKVYDNDAALQSEIDDAVRALTLKVAEARLLGDVNGDGKINTADSAALLRSVAELDMLSEDAAASADVNSNGAVDTSDAVLILQYAAEKITAF